MVSECTFRFSDGWLLFKKLKLVDNHLFQDCLIWTPLVDMMNTTKAKKRKKRNKEEEEEFPLEAWDTNLACSELLRLTSTLKPTSPLDHGEITKKFQQLRDLHGKKVWREAKESDPQLDLFDTTIVLMSFYRAKKLYTTDKELPTKSELTDAEADAQSSPIEKNHKQAKEQDNLRMLYGEYFLDTPHVEPGTITSNCKFLSCRMLPLQPPIQLGPQIGKGRKRGGRLQFAGHPPHLPWTIRGRPPPEECDDAVAFIIELVAEYLLGCYTTVTSKL